MPGDTVFVDLALNGKEIDGGVVTAMDREDYETLVEPWAGAALSLKLDRSSTDPGTCQGSRYVQLGDNRLHRLIKRDELQEKEKEGGKHVVDHINGERNLMSQITFPFIVNMIGSFKERAFD